MYLQGNITNSLKKTIIDRRRKIGFGLGDKDKI